MTVDDDNRDLAETVRAIEPHLGFELEHAQRDAPGSTWEAALQIAIAELRAMRGKWPTIPIASWTTPHGELLVRGQGTPPAHVLLIDAGRMLELQGHITRMVFDWIQHGSLPSGRHHVGEAVEMLIAHEAEVIASRSAAD